MGESKGYVRSSDEKGSVNISEDVVAVIVATATVEVDGVHGLYQSYGKEIVSVVGKRGLSKGIKLNIDGEDVTIDISIIADIGYSVGEVGAEVQKAVMSAVESAVGVAVKAVNVHICGISLKKTK